MHGSKISGASGYDEIDYPQCTKDLSIQDLSLSYCDKVNFETGFLNAQRNEAKKERPGEDVLMVLTSPGPVDPPRHPPRGGIGTPHVQDSVRTMTEHLQRQDTFSRLHTPTTR